MHFIIKPTAKRLPSALRRTTIYNLSGCLAASLRVEKRHTLCGLEPDFLEHHLNCSQIKWPWVRVSLRDTREMKPHPALKGRAKTRSSLRDWWALFDGKWQKTAAMSGYTVSETAPTALLRPSHRSRGRNTRRCRINPARASCACGTASLDRFPAHAPRRRGSAGSSAKL